MPTSLSVSIGLSLIVSLFVLCATSTAGVQYTYDNLRRHAHGWHESANKYSRNNNTPHATLHVCCHVQWGGAASTHYLALFAVRPCPQTFHGYYKALRPFTVLQVESDLRAASLKATMFEVLTFYGKDFSNMACLIGDNCSTNKCLAHNINLRFIVCAIHRQKHGFKIILRS